jgi:hypothetical protein
MMTETPMDWLFTDENMATAIVIAGFGLFSLASCLTARWVRRPLRHGGPVQRQTIQQQKTIPTHGTR